MDFEGEESINKKQIIIIGGVFLILVLIVFIVIFSVKHQKQKRLIEEKVKRAESLKVEDFLKEIAEEKWEETADKECKISRKSPLFNGFSWITEGKMKESSVLYMGAKKLNIFFYDKSGKCCGDMEKFWEKLKMHLEKHEFSQNRVNDFPEKNIFAFENDGLKCIYGYKNVINAKNFCEFGIICGRENKSISNYDFSSIFSFISENKPSYKYKLISIDKMVDTVYGKFVLGKIGFLFFDGIGDVFLIKKETGSESWQDISYIFQREKIICDYLIDEKIPPEIISKCFDYSKGKMVDYEKLYKERYK